MSELSMTKQEREDFLTALHVGVLAVERPEGPPLVTPVWYRYTPDGVVEFVTDRSSEKAVLLERSGHGSLCAQREEYPYAYVAVDGPVETAIADRATRLDIAIRYLGTEMGTEYIDGSPDADEVVVRLRPARWRTTDYAKGGPRRRLTGASHPRRHRAGAEAAGAPGGSVAHRLW